MEYLLELNIIRYCAEECVRQQSGTMSVYDMCNAWAFAQKFGEECPVCREGWKEIHEEQNSKIDLNFIERLGELVEPEDNKLGFRTIPIFVGNGFESIEKAPWQRVPELLDRLITAYYAGGLDPDEQIIGARAAESWGLYRHLKKAESAEDVFYYEYENIHPFRDGNGRTGKILYNYLKGTLDNPILPPNFWNSANP